VMDSGRVQAAGTHAELIAASPLYAELAATQFLVTGEIRQPQSHAHTAAAGSPSAAQTRTPQK